MQCGRTIVRSMPERMCPVRSYSSWAASNIACTRAAPLSARAVGNAYHVPRIQCKLCLENKTFLRACERAREQDICSDSRKCRK